jgi:hypothetical protein
LLFGSGTVLTKSCRMDRLILQTRWDRKWKSEVYKQNCKDDQSFSYKLLGTIKCSNTLKLH